MFVDEVKVELTAGKGGNGIVAYRRELKIEKGGPYGGNGGAGGSIIFIGDENLSTLLDLRYNKVIKGIMVKMAVLKVCMVSQQRILIFVYH